MNITKKMIPCDCQNTACKEFKTCCFVATEVVHVTADPDADAVHLMFIGQGAGKDEDIHMNPKNVLRQPFVGRAGAYLRNMIKFLWDSGVLVNVAISNSVRFHPRGVEGKDRDPTQEELDSCIHILNRDIETVKPGVLIPLGKSTTAALLPALADTAMGKIMGNSYEYNGIKAMPMFHPSFLTRNYGKFFPDQKGDYHVRCVNALRGAANFALGGGDCRVGR